MKTLKQLTSVLTVASMMFGGGLFAEEMEDTMEPEASYEDAAIGSGYEEGVFAPVMAPALGVVTVAGVGAAAVLSKKSSNKSSSGTTHSHGHAHASHD